MFKKILVIILFLSLVFGANLAVAAKQNNREDRQFKIKDDAVEVGDGVYSLGQAYDSQSHELVEGYAIVHKKNNEARKGGPIRTSACYGFMASGAKWKNVEDWVVNPANNSGLYDNFIKNTLADDIALWEDAADGVLGSGSGVNILGNGSITNDTLVADQVSTDNKNEVYFANLGSDGTIAVTIVWGIFGGPTFNRRLVEWDQVYNTYYPWSSSGEAGKMDFDNIAQHELGHSVGMADIYNSSCSNVTMFGYADYGETKKQTLEAPDITGVSILY